MVIRSFDIASVVKVCGVLYASMGLLIGAFLSVLSIVTGALTSSASHRPDVPGLLFGVGAIVVLPIVYGLVGAIASALGAAVYNAVAQRIGGVSIDLVVESPQVPYGIGPHKPGLTPG